MTRAEHIAWCKQRALAEIDYSHDPRQGVISMMSDLRKHPDTSSETMTQLCTMVLLGGEIMTRQQAIDFINGFN